MLLGYESATPQPHLLIQMYDSIPSAFQKTDLNLALISSELLLAEQQNCFSPYPAINHFRIKLEVENTSASAIDSFFINGSWQPAAWLNIYACYLYCFAPQLAIKQNVHLNPGETASVEVDVSNGMLDPLPVCFWVSSPNGQSDRNPSDDRICMSVSVGLDELKPQLSDFTVIPNPASGVISVSFQNQPSGMSRNLELYDVSGRMVDRYAIQSSTTVIPIHQLAAGVYILKAIDTSASVSVKRVIIK